jgi:hypothetical protein
MPQCRAALVQKAGTRAATGEPVCDERGQGHPTPTKPSPHKHKAHDLFRGRDLSARGSCNRSV